MNARTADAVVIGAGIAGCATAYYLSKKGLNVVVVDKGEVGDEQSSRAWGFVRQQARTARELPLMIAGAIVWQEMEKELGADVEWNQGGSLTLAGDEEILGRIRAWLKVGEKFGIETKFLTNEDVEELLPAMRGEWLGAMYTPSDGHAQPNKATNAIAIGAREHGALFRTMEAVEGIEVTDGQVSAVVTERDRIVTKNVVCAAGAWSHKVARMVGLAPFPTGWCGRASGRLILPITSPTWRSSGPGSPSGRGQRARSTSHRGPGAPTTTSTWTASNTSVFSCQTSGGTERCSGSMSGAR